MGMSGAGVIPLLQIVNPAALQQVLTFLLRDDFATDAGAPLTSPRACDPGPGTLTLSQLDGSLSISSSRLNVPSQPGGAGGFGELGYLGTVVSGRPSGVAFMNEWTWTTLSNPVPCGWAFNNSLNFGGFANLAGGIYFPSPGTTWIVDNAGGFALGGAGPSAGVSYKLAVVGRSAGWYFLIKGGVFADWTLLWVGDRDTRTGLRPAYSEFGSVASSDFARVADLVVNGYAEWSDYGIATQRIAGAVPGGQAFTHEANCHIEWTQTTLPAGNNNIEFRRQDSNNLWDAEIYSTGDFRLYEKVAGGYMLRASAAGVVSAGDRIVIIANGTTIRGFSNNTLRWTYSSASNFQTATSGLYSLVSGTLSDLIAWPFTLSGANAAGLEAVANA